MLLRALAIRSTLAVAAAFSCVLAPLSARAALLPGPLAELQLQLSAFVQHAPGMIAVEIKDLDTGAMSAINPSRNMPAASVIKIPVMVEVFRQMALGKFDLNRKVTLMANDRDWGWGDLADARVGSRYTVSRLLSLMITESDNTATNMLIRLVGRWNINHTMADLGLPNTRLGDYIRSEGDIRTLRTSPADMVELLNSMAHEQLVDPWSSRAMISILEGQHHNGLLPEPLPHGLSIAHKTGTLHDTLNDVGIVYLNSEPYIIAVLTTHLPDLDLGRQFIQGVSRMAYTAFEHFAAWRSANETPALQNALDDRTGTDPNAAGEMADPRATPATNDWMTEGAGG